VDGFSRRLVPDGFWEIAEPLIPVAPKRTQGDGGLPLALAVSAANLHGRVWPGEERRDGKRLSTCLRDFHRHVGALRLAN
jgi:hypothetical protein